MFKLAKLSHTVKSRKVTLAMDAKREHEFLSANVRESR